MPFNLQTPKVNSQSRFYAWEIRGEYNTLVKRSRIGYRTRGEALRSGQRQLNRLNRSSEPLDSEGLIVVTLLAIFFVLTFGLFDCGCE